MPTHIAFLRAVNIRPRWVKMAELRELLTDNGFRDVETHIQSGNVRVTTSLRSSAKVAAQLETLIEERFGFPVPCVMRTPAQLVTLAERCASEEPPFADVAGQYVTLAKAPFAAEHAAELEAWDAPGECLRVFGSDAIWWLATSAHQAKMSNARLERGGAVGTTRNVTVITQLAERWG